MLPKNTLKTYLLIGANLLVLFIACGPADIEYTMTMDLIYENSTDSLIQFTLNDVGKYESLSSTLRLVSNSSSDIYTYDLEGVGEVIDPLTCCQDFLVDILASRGQHGITKLLILNDTLCVNHHDELSVMLDNYRVEEVDDRHFRYNYTFTNQDFVGAEICN